MKWLRLSGPGAPLGLLALLKLVDVALLHLGSILRQHDLYFTNKWFLGMDYQDFYRASQALHTGLSPYTVERYVTPPLPAQINLLAVHLPFPALAVLVAVGALIAVAGAVGLMARTFRQDSEPSTISRPSLAVLVAFSYPVYFLVDRGNIDGFVLLAMVLGLWSYRRGNNMGAGLAWAVAAAAKVYPVLLLLPLAARRQWRPCLWFLAGLAILALIQPHLWLEYGRERLASRADQFVVGENGSLAAACYNLGRVLDHLRGAPGEAVFADGLRRLWPVLYVLTLGLALFADLRRPPSEDRVAEAARLALYLPFMVAVPALSYAYELVALLAVAPVVAWLWVRSPGRAPRLALFAVSLGIGLTQCQALAWSRLLGSDLPWLATSLGTLLAVVGVTVWRWTAGARDPDPAVTEASPKG